jgi:ribosomal protein S18 acetylase RimI-like enzyme
MKGVVAQAAGSGANRVRGEHARIEIRPVALSDLDAIDAIEAASFTVDRFPRRNLARALRSRSAVLLLAECEEAPAGYILLLFRKGAKAARLYSLATAPSARGKGVAAALVDAGVAHAAEKGCDRLTLEVRRSNGDAIRLYERCGFERLREVPRYYDDGESALRMEKRVDLESSKAR